MSDKIKIKLNKKDEKKNVKDTALLKAVFLVRYKDKFDEFGFAKNFVYQIIDNDPEGEDIIALVDKSSTKDEFVKNTQEFLKSQRHHTYSQTLLLGNLTGQYDLHYSRAQNLKNLNIDAFSKENVDLLQDLKEHFVEYILKDNKRKNAFAEQKEKSFANLKITYKNFVIDIREKDLLDFFDLVLINKQWSTEISGNVEKYKYLIDYVISTVGTYSREDIKNNFDFILYDLDNAKGNSLDKRRERYMSLKGLSESQIKKIDQVGILKQRLKDMDNYQATALEARLDDIDGNFKDNIKELEDIYLDYELLYRQELVDNLFVPKKDLTIVTNYKDIKPQLIHQFLRNVDKFKEKEYNRVKEKIIAERLIKQQPSELTQEECLRVEALKKQVDANVDRYKVNYSITDAGGVYSDSIGLEYYQSDTSNQISAQLFKNDDFKKFKTGIRGIGFNNETLSPEAIAMSSGSYKTTNKSLNRLEYDETRELEEMSAPIQDLKLASMSEVVLQRRGIDFDTKASYIFAVIDSSNEKETKNIMEEIKAVQEKENLKVVVYDKYKIEQSLKEQNFEEQSSKEQSLTD